MKSLKLPKIASNGIWAFTGQVGSTIAGLAFFGFLARVLTREEMGIYFLLTSITMFFSIVGSIGLPEALVRVLAQLIGANKKQEAKAAGSISILAVLQISIFTAGLATYLISTQSFSNTFNLNHFEFSLIAVSIWIASSSVQSIICEYFRGLHDIKRATLFNNFGKNIWSLLTAILAWLYVEDFSLNIAIISAAAGLAINNMIGLLQLRKATVFLGTKTHFSLAELMKIAAPLCANTLLIFTLTRFGVWAIGAFAPPAQIALYGAAIQFVTLLAMPLMVVNAVVPPLIASQYFNSKSHDSLQTTLRSVTTISTMPAILAMCIIIVWGSDLLDIVYGDKYRDSYMLLIILALGQVINVFVGPSGTLLKMTGNQALLLKINLIFGVLSATFTVYAALQYGAIGVAIVTGITMASQNVLSLFVATQRTQIICCSYINPTDFKIVISRIKQRLTSVRT